MTLFKSPQAYGKTRWLAAQTKKYPKGTVVYYISHSKNAHATFLTRLQELNVNPDDYNLVLLNPSDLSCNEWYEEFVNDMDTAVFCLDEVSTLVSQCNARQLLLLGAVMSGNCYVTDTSAVGLAIITNS